MGDSGNAEGGISHLHFEIRGPNDDPLNPYQSLKAATVLSAPSDVYAKSDTEILPFDTFKGGSTVALGNFKLKPSDLTEEMIVAGSGPGRNPLVKIIKKDGTEINSFDAYDSGFRGGVNVAAVDIDGDGISEIITAAGALQISTSRKLLKIRT